MVPLPHTQNNYCGTNMYFPLKMYLLMSSLGLIYAMMSAFEKNSKVKKKPNLFNPSTLSSDFLLRHSQLNVCAVKC